MEYIISRGFSLPDSERELENSDWFNMWANQLFPYKELVEGDILYWYDSTQEAIVWKSRVVKIIRFPYNSKQEIIDKFKDVSEIEYFQTRAEKGFFINYRVKVIDKLHIQKPQNFKFPQLGWFRVEKDLASTWLNVDK